jgi:hypothetical protein
MIERGGCCLLLEAAHGSRLEARSTGSIFQRWFRVQPCIFREIHLAHSALANLRANFVTTKFCADAYAHAGLSGLLLEVSKKHDIGDRVAARECEPTAIVREVEPVDKIRCEIGQLHGWAAV